MAKFMPSNGTRFEEIEDRKINTGLPAEHRVAAKLMDRGLEVWGPSGKPYRGTDLMVSTGPFRPGCPVEVKTTSGDVATVDPFYCGEAGYYVIEKRKKNTYQYFTIKPEELRPLIESNIGFKGKNSGVEIKKLRKYRDDGIKRILSKPKEISLYRRKYSEFFRKLDSAARKKDGDYRYGWNWGKVSKEAHKLTRKDLKASTS